MILVGEVPAGVVGMELAAASDELALEARLLLRLRQALNSAKQWLQEREGDPRGL